MTLVKRIQDFDSEDLIATIALCRNDFGGLHTGIVYRDRETQRKFILHLAFHLRLERDELTHNIPELWSGSGCFVLPEDFPEELQVQLAAACRNIFNVKDQSEYKYGFYYDGDSYFDKDFQLILHPPASGLTCSTFVLTAFSSIGETLIDVQSWLARQEDADFQMQILQLLARYCDADHYAKVCLEVGSPRIRPNEVGAGLTFKDRPVENNEIIQRGEEINQRIP